MVATMHRTEQWLSHHHLALAALVTLLAVVIIGLARSLTWTMPAPVAPEIKAPSAAYSAAVTRYQNAKERQAEVQDRAVAATAPSAIIPTAQQRYLDLKERQAETQDRTTAPTSSTTAPAAMQRYQNAKERQAEMQDRAVAVSGPTAAQNAEYQQQRLRLREMNTSGDPELDAGLMPGAYSDARSGPH